MVFNYSFEDTSYCPSSASNLYVADGWYSPTLASPDYFNTCTDASDPVAVPVNLFGYQYPRTGNGYAGFYLFVDYIFGEYREYAQSRLVNKLQAGKTYCVEFYVTLSDSSEYACRNIGALFTQTAISGNNQKHMPYNPQVLSNSNWFITDTVNWVKISGSFVAQGNEEYITIGNFDDSASTMVVHFNFVPPLGNVAFASYYYIDDIYVWDCTEPSVLPNVFTPNNDAVNDYFQYQCQPENFVSIHIYNRWGNLVFESNTYGEYWNGKSKPTNQDCSSGVYYIILNTLTEQKTGFIQLIR